MSAALQLVDSSAHYDTRQLDILKRTIATGLEDNEFALLVEVAKRTGLDLFARQLYGIKRGGKMTLQTGIDGYRLMAARTGALAGIDDATYDDESGKHPGRASVTVWRFVQGTRVPFSATARWLEYYQPQGGMWDKMPFLMLAKCAEALALRKAFPAELSGVYTNEEMQQADGEATSYATATVEARPIVGVSRSTGEVTRGNPKTTARKPVADLISTLHASCVKNQFVTTQDEWDQELATCLGPSYDGDESTLTHADFDALKDHFAAMANSLRHLPVPAVRP